MKKVNVGLILASLFIAGVMIFLMTQGVHLKERRMVKWSAVVSPQEAGTKVARFFFPITREFGKVHIIGESLFAESFFSTFKEEGVKNSAETQYFLNSNVDEAFSVEVRSIDEEYVERCKAGDRLSCIAIKAKNIFLKKERDLNKNWINMHRLTKNRAVLFYRDKESR